MKPMLASTYEGQNIKGWLMSEKYDGVRAIWDGTSLKSRNGKVFHAPQWFIEQLPATALDGELWEDRGEFQRTVGKVRSKNGDWSNIKFMIFDTPTNGTYLQRLKRLTSLNLPNHCQIVEQKKCSNREQLESFESTILKKAGEGVMLRKPNSPYEHKRSRSLLKVKRLRCDEAEIVGYTKGKGKNVEKIGALICKYMGKTFNIGTGISDMMREKPPILGSIVTFSFFETTDSGIPRFPSFVAVRDYE